MGVNGDHASKGWKSQRVLDLINFLRRRLVHGQDVHERTCTQSFRAHSISRETRFPVFVDSHEHIYVPEYYQYLIQGLKMLLKTFLKWLYPCQNHPDIPFISANWCTDLIEVWLISNQGCKSKYAFANRCKFLPVLFCCWAIRSQSVCMLIQISRFLCVWTWLRDG